MKKLLVIAVAAALTAPMAAMADTSVYGKAHVSINKASGQSLDLQSHSSRIGLKGSNALDNGLTATHKFEMGINIADNNCSTPGAVATAMGPPPVPCAADNGLTDRDAWVGLKGGFGEVRFGRQTVPSDLVDDAADFMTNGHALDNSAGRQNNSIAYINKFGNVGFALAHIADGTSGASAVDKANDLMLNYTAGPIYAGVGYTDYNTAQSNPRVALAYTGANFGVGFVHEKQGTYKANTISGKYNFGKAYVAAEYGKEKTSGDKSQILELGYGLGKNTKTYVEYSKQGGGGGATPTKNARVGLVHSF